MAEKLIWQRGHQNTMESRERAIAYYERHIETIKAEVPRDRLLVFTVDQGWGPLCAFLGLPVPETAFPNVNSRAEFQKIKQAMVRGAYAILAICAVVSVVSIYGVRQLLSS